MAKKIQSLISINESENWGNLVNPRQHIAAVGARLADNRSRDFGVFGDRITVVGQEDVAEKLHKWLFGRKTLKAIAKMTRYVWDGDADENEWYPISLGKKYEVRLHVRCCGEYCHVAAYADKVKEMEHGQ